MSTMEGIYAAQKQLVAAFNHIAPPHCPIYHAVNCSFVPASRNSKKYSTHNAQPVTTTATRVSRWRRLHSVKTCTCTLFLVSSGDRGCLKKFGETSGLICVPIGVMSHTEQTYMSHIRATYKPTYITYMWYHIWNIYVSIHAICMRKPICHKRYIHVTYMTYK